MVNIQIFKDYDEFCNREDKSVNGVSQHFLSQKNRALETINLNNCEGCWECKDCENCRDCVKCYDCKNCDNCFHCVKCENCENCKGCGSCENCENCFVCISCVNCKNCIRCKFCYDNEDCIDVYFLENVNSFLYKTSFYKKINNYRTRSENDYHISINSSFSLDIKAKIEDVIEDVIKDLKNFINNFTVNNDNPFIIGIGVYDEKMKKRILNAYFVIISFWNVFYVFNELQKDIYLIIDISKINPNGPIDINEMAEYYNGGSWNEYIYKENNLWKLKENDVKQKFYEHFIRIFDL